MKRLWGETTSITTYWNQVNSFFFSYYFLPILCFHLFCLFKFYFVIWSLKILGQNVSRAVSVLATKHSDIVKGLVPVGNNQVIDLVQHYFPKKNYDSLKLCWAVSRATWTTWRGIMHGTEPLEEQLEEVSRPNRLRIPLPVIVPVIQINLSHYI